MHATPVGRPRPASRARTGVGGRAADARCRSSASTRACAASSPTNCRQRASSPASHRRDPKTLKAKSLGGTELVIALDNLAGDITRTPAQRPEAVERFVRTILATVVAADKVDKPQSKEAFTASLRIVIRHGDYLKQSARPGETSIRHDRRSQNHSPAMQSPSSRLMRVNRCRSRLPVPAPSTASPTRNCSPSAASSSANTSTI